MMRVHSQLVLCMNVPSEQPFFQSEAFLSLFLRFIYLFLVMLSLRCCSRAFCSGGKRGCSSWLLAIAVLGLLVVVASPVAELRL